MGYNMFAYCNDNPVMYYDPNGELWAEIIGCIILAFTLSSCGESDEVLPKDEIKELAEGLWDFSSNYSSVQKAQEIIGLNLLLCLKNPDHPIWNLDVQGYETQMKTDLEYLRTSLTTPGGLMIPDDADRKKLIEILSTKEVFSQEDARFMVYVALNARTKAIPNVTIFNALNICKSGISLVKSYYGIGSGISMRSTPREVPFALQYIKIDWDRLVFG